MQTSADAELHSSTQLALVVLSLPFDGCRRHSFLARIGRAIMDWASCWSLVGGVVGVIGFGVGVGGFWCVLFFELPRLMRGSGYGPLVLLLDRLWFGGGVLFGGVGLACLAGFALLDGWG